jgi:hypothetical protein
MKKILLPLLLFIPFLGFGQNLVTETFNYTVGGLVLGSSGNWSSNSGIAGTLVTTTGSLTYSTYYPGNIGNKVAIVNGSSEDAITSFTSQSGTGLKVYASFLINVTAATASGDYFIHFLSGTASFKSRVFIKSSGTGFDLGIDGDGSSPTYVAPTTAYVFNTTYLVVIAYTFNAGANDDIVSLWVNPDISTTTEPAPIVTKSVATDYTSLSALGLRQASGNTPSLSVDGIKIGTSWASSTLPISLTSFTGKPLDQSILLNWATASESNNDYFEVLTSTNGKTFTSVGTLKGSGTTTDVKNYSFVDANPAAGTNYYQLVQHDFDGKSSKSEITPVNSAIANSSLTVYAATTSVNVSINSANQTDGTLQIFDITGKKLNETRLSLTKGFNTLSLPLSLNSGIHVVNFVTGAEVISSKFIKE